MTLLPPSIKYRVKSLLQSKRFRYQIATALDLLLIVLILISGRQPAQRLIFPLAAARFFPHSTFAFVPDLARDKFGSIDLQGLTYLSFFDVPLRSDGQLNFNSRGYQSFTSDEASALFDRARFQKTKILLTLSAQDPNIIEGLLDNPDAQATLVTQAINAIQSSNINGVAIDFEYPQGGGQDYQDKFTNFLSTLTASIHAAVPQAEVAVGVPDSLSNNQSLYNTKDLSKACDRVFLIASDFIVPEVKNTNPASPAFGYNGNEYWSGVSQILTNLTQSTPAQKLVMERAWYGSGDNYPLYVPDNTNRPENQINPQPFSIALDQATLDQLVAGVPTGAQEAARRNIPIITNALAREGILNTNVLAYALATVEHETDGTFEPIKEIQGVINARRFGYEGGSNYFGRGFIQITHLRNYLKLGERIGLGDQLVKNPDLASTPEIAAKILAAYFKDNNVANLASQGDFVDAREPINPDYNGRSIANLAFKYELNQ